MIQLDGRTLTQEKIMFKDVSHLAGLEADWSRHAVKENVISAVSAHTHTCVHTCDMCTFIHITVMCLHSIHACDVCTFMCVHTCMLLCVCVCTCVGATEELGHCVH